MAGETAATNAGVEELREPWWGTSSASARSRAPARATSSRSAWRSTSAASSAAPPAVATRTTQERSFSRLRSPGSAAAGCSTSKATPSHAQPVPARHGRERGARPWSALPGGSGDSSQPGRRAFASEVAPPA